MPPKKATAGASTKQSTAKPKASAKAPSKTTAQAPAKKTTKTTKTAAAANIRKARAPLTNGTAKPAAKRGRPAKANGTSAPSNAPVTDGQTGNKKPVGRPRKRKATEEDTGEGPSTAAADATTAPAARPGRPTKKAKVTPHVAINDAPTQKLHVLVCGEGAQGELGLGSAKNAIDVKRPRLNANLSPETVGVVQVAAGGMHVAALTHDNKILTWGVNDQGALGRDTTWEGGLIDIDENKSDDDDDDDDENSGLNPREATPTAIPQESFPEGTKFTQVATSDSATFALTDEGFVYGWGTFRSNEGIFGFTKDVKVQRTPMLLPDLKKIKSLACGADHVLALDAKGNVFAWGSGQQNQLGRRVIERTKAAGLVPREFGLPRGKIHYVECGAYHSFAIDNSDTVWAWGLNNFGETGIPENAGEEGAVIINPTKVEELSGRKMTCLKGGAHHSIGVTEAGDCLVWGRLDGFQMGIKIDGLPEDHVKRDEWNKPRILKVPTKVPNVPEAAFATCGADHSIAITKDGKAYSWGFSANYQTGLGTDEDVEVAQLIENTAMRGKKVNWAGGGGQYSIFTAPADEPMVNGVKTHES